MRRAMENPMTAIILTTTFSAILSGVASKLMDNLINTVILAHSPKQAVVAPEPSQPLSTQQPLVNRQIERRKAIVESRNLRRQSNSTSDNNSEKNRYDKNRHSVINVLSYVSDTNEDLLNGFTLEEDLRKFVYISN